MDIKALPDEYFEALGRPKPGRPFSIVDDYRFYMAYKRLAPGSVLDVGTYFGDFLKLALKDGRQAFGTDVNQARVDLANELLGRPIVSLDFRNGMLGTFSDNHVDNVVCTEVLEHTPDRFAVRELCRVARKRVIITVPFKEKIQEVLCLHCCRYTPYSGHLHSYDFDSFPAVLPENWSVTEQLSFAKPKTRVAIQKFRLGRSRKFLPLIATIDRAMPGQGRWLLVVLGCDSKVGQ
jgi:SAM-dependent methyltransferase